MLIVKDVFETKKIKIKMTEKLKICVYCSSSPTTKEKYLEVAYNLGQLIAKSGHITLTGAGINGCMGYVNKGARENGGEIIGVTHQLFHGGDPNITNKIVVYINLSYLLHLS